MPHLILEYTDNLTPPLEWQPLFAALHAALMETCGVMPENCKSRAIPLHDYRLGGDGGATAWVHLTVRMFPRPSEPVRAFGERAVALLQDACDTAAPGHLVQVSVEIAEINRETYFKGA